MMNMRTVHFRWFIILLVSLISLVTLGVSGTGIFWLRGLTINRDIDLAGDKTVQNLAERTEGMLASVEQSLITLVHTSLLVDRKDFSLLVQSTMPSQPLIRAMYFLDEGGKTFAIWTRDGRNPGHPDFMGIDFSYTPLYKSLKTPAAPIWSDKFVSTLAGDTSIGVGIRIEKHAAIAELELATLLKTVETASESNARIWVIDRQGEVLADTQKRNAAGILNILREPVIELALAGEALPDKVKLQGAWYHPAAAHSVKLGWLFLAGIPTGLDNPLIQNTLKDILFLSGSFLLIALLLSPLWSFVIARQLESLKHLADRIADGEESPVQKMGIIQEFNDLSAYLQDMSDRIRERENALRDLNQELEQHVADRTRELEDRNHDLRESLERNTQIQTLLVQTEKLAALGRLVAGVAHELNTPIGNAVMAISTLKDGRKRLTSQMTKGLRKSDLDHFLEHTEQGLEIAMMNVNRAAELITSFKHVASDQTSSIRRKFELSDLIRDVLLTLHPMLKRSPHQLVTNVENNVVLDSYPGVIGQILTNLITNALIHAWEDGQQGTIAVVARSTDDEGWFRISVSDNGQGIPESIKTKVFDPFFTTRMGRGGTGLGLNIAYNGAHNVLGGNLKLESEPGQGTTFNLDIPLVAPVLQNEDPPE